MFTSCFNNKAITTTKQFKLNYILSDTMLTELILERDVISLSIANIVENTLFY